MSTPVVLKITQQPRSSHPDPAQKPEHKPRKKVQHKPPPKQGMRVVLSPIAGTTAKGTFHRNQVPTRLQCPPTEPFTITRGHDSQEYETISDGTFSVPASAKLDIVQFKTLFVEDDFPWMLERDYDIGGVRLLLERISDGGTPFLLSCAHYGRKMTEYHGPVTLTDYIHTENEPFTYYADLTFKQYRDPQVSDKKAGRPHAGRHWPVHHRLTSSDTLYGLARKYYGKPSLARLIAKANHIRSTDFKEPIVKLGGRWKKGSMITVPRPTTPKPKRKSVHAKVGIDA